MSTFKSRLIDAAQHFGIEPGQSAIARWLGIDRRQVVDNWLGKGKPSAKYLPLFQAKGINSDWLLTGRGEMLLPAEKQISSDSGQNKDLQEIQATWDTLSAKQRQTLKDTLLDLARTFARANATRGIASNGLPDARSRGPGKRAKNGQSSRGHRR